MTANSYDYWNAKLDGENPDPPPDRTQLPCGFWRLNNDIPLAVWIDDSGARVALQGRRSMSPMAMERMAEMGGFGKAVTEEDYRRAVVDGYWPGDPPRPQLGDNLPDDPNEVLILEIAGEIETATEFLKTPITTQEDADKAAVWARRIGVLVTKADDARQEQKRPHLEASRAVDEHWRPTITAGGRIVTLLKHHVFPWLQKKKQEELDRAAAAAEAAARLREQAKRTEEADREAAAALKDEADVLEKEAEPGQITAGRKNYKVALRTVTVARIVDYDKAYTALKNHDDMKVFVQQLADRFCRAKLPLDGVEYVKEERAA